MAQEVAGEVAQDRDGLGRVAGKDSALVLREGDVEHPVGTTLDAPVAAHSRTEGFGAERPSQGRSGRVLAVGGSPGERPPFAGLTIREALGRLFPFRISRGKGRDCLADRLREG